VTSYLVDTDWIIDCLHGRIEAISTLRDLTPEGLAISLITYGELYQGAYYAPDRGTALHGLRTFLRGKRLLLLNRAIIERYGVIRGGLSRRGQTVSDADLLIAATAMHHGLTLVTRNRRHFARIPDLRIYERQ